MVDMYLQFHTCIVDLQFQLSKPEIVKQVLKKMYFNALHTALALKIKVCFTSPCQSFLGFFGYVS